MIVLAALFLTVLFIIKNGLPSFLNPLNYLPKNKQTVGLIYGNSTVEDLVNKDTDGDGVPDWQEQLFGLDPNKKETTPGIRDSVALEQKIKASQANTDSSDGTSTATQNSSTPTTKTDEFSQQLFSTVASLSQNGTLDQSAIDQITSSLADHIQNTPVRKVYTMTDIKITKDNSINAVKNYVIASNNIHKKYPSGKDNITNIMQKFMGDENNINSSILKELNPIIVQLQGTLSEIAKTTVPSDLAQNHLDFINSIERLIENLEDIQLYDTDTIVAFGGVSQYQKNNTSFQNSLINLQTAINKKLNG